MESPFTCLQAANLPPASVWHLLQGQTGKHWGTRDASEHSQGAAANDALEAGGLLPNIPAGKMPCAPAPPPQTRPRAAPVTSAAGRGGPYL